MNQIADFLIGNPGLLPRGACLAWQPRFVWVLAAADVLSALACISIPAAALVFLARRRDLDPVARGLGLLFVAFLISYFFMHVAALVTLWIPAYGAQGIVKILMAAVSVIAAIVVWPQLPKLLRLPSPGDLQRANAALEQNNASLETTVAWRTHELEQAKERFEMALARSNITVFTQDRDLRYTWVHNPQEGLTPKNGAAEPAGDPEEVPRRMKQRVLLTGETANAVVSVGTRLDGIRHYDLTLSPIHDRSGVIEGVLGTAVDVTEKRLFEVRLAAMAAQLATAYRRFEMALDKSPITVFEQDADLRYTFVHNPPPGTSIELFIGRVDAEILSEADQRKIVPAKQRVLMNNQRETLEADVNIGGVSRFYDLRLEPKSGESGGVEGVIGTAVDLTERRRNEQQMRLVMRELTHRSKNLLAVIQAMARKTASTAPDINHFIRDFSSRLRAIAAAHDLLVAESWSGAELRALLSASLSQTVDPAGPEISMDGPPLKLSPDAAQTLALAFHELTMNAAKHGALSVPGGKVSVRWSASGGQVRFCWREAGGPPVQPPQRTGFGRVLLERLVGASLGGSVALEFPKEGLHCEVEFPAARLIAA